MQNDIQTENRRKVDQHPAGAKYVRGILPRKRASTQRENMLCLAQLRPLFDSAPIDAIRPQDIARYRDTRSAPVRGNREIALLSHVFNIARERGHAAAQPVPRGAQEQGNAARLLRGSGRVGRGLQGRERSAARRHGLELPVGPTTGGRAEEEQARHPKRRAARPTEQDATRVPDPPQGRRRAHQAGRLR